MIELCKNLKKRLKETNDPTTFSLWLSPLKLESEDHLVTVISTSEFTKKMIKDKFSDQIKSILTDLTNEKYKLRFKCQKPEEEINLKNKTEKPDQHVTIRTKTQKELKLSSKFTFDSFVIGKNNQLASAAAKAVVHSPGVSYNPLFIYGKTGLGKTHLMQAIGNAIIEQDPAKKILYITCEEFTNLMIEAIKRNSMQKFRTKFRKLDVLMIDDIQFLAKKEQTQEEFFNTFNALYQDHKQIVLTSDCQPKELMNLQKRLVSRFEWGIVTDIQPPSYETRMSILKKKSEMSHMKVSMEVISFLAEHFDENVRQIEGALNRVYTYSKLINRMLNVELAQEVLKDLIKLEKAKRITIDEILQKVGTFYNITILQLQGQKRLKNFAFPRHIAMYIARTFTDLSYPEIGQAFGGRDHTTVMHAYKKINKKLANDKQMKEEINSISQMLLKQ